MKKKLKISIKKYENNKLIYQEHSCFEFNGITEIIMKFFFSPIVIYISVLQLFLNFVLFILKTIDKLISIFNKK